MRDWAPPRAEETPAAAGGETAPPPSPAPAPPPSEGADPSSALAEAEADLGAVRDAIAGTIVGQKTLISRLLIALLCDGHCLLEGVPGLAKSLSVSTLAASLHADFVRVQFTPDLLPADLTGTEIYNARTSEFETRKGPMFANIVLADEINRAPAKVQSALLEAMEERQVSIGGESFALPQPFMVLATRNPIEQEGTYPLPEAQLDRFLMKIVVDYPPEDDEREILERGLGAPAAPPDPVITTEAVLRARAVVGEVRLTTAIRDYVVRLIRATRQPGRVDADLERLIRYGASPRAAIALAQAARAHAFLDARGYTTPEDVKAVAPDVLRHRLILTYEAEADGVVPEDIVERMLDGVAVR